MYPRGADNHPFRSESRSLHVRRFPLRTLLLMALALLAFIRLWYLTHAERRDRPPPPAPAGAERVIDVAPPAQVHPACRPLERALEGMVRAPEDAQAFALTRKLLEECPEPPARACALGAALDARSPMDAGTTPLRELLEALCQRCPAAHNPCAERVTRAVMGLGAGRVADLAGLRWSLEHAGPGKGPACAEVARSLLALAALATEEPTAGQREVLAALGPLCAEAGLLPRNVLHAAVVEGEVPALASLASEAPAREPSLLTPDRVMGAAGGALTVSKGPRWEREGALSAVFEPPVRQLTSVRVKASGPGTVRAVVRTEGEVGLFDPDTGRSFVLPTACRFQGTGDWETCSLPVPLLDVEALGVFPGRQELTLNALEARGVR
jgi:hypothetical protein